VVEAVVEIAMNGQIHNLQDVREERVELEAAALEVLPVMVLMPPLLVVVAAAVVVMVLITTVQTRVLVAPAIADMLLSVTPQSVEVCHLQAALRLICQ
jgi:uncharacterized membrane protein (DUF106 family)